MRGTLLLATLALIGAFASASVIDNGLEDADAPETISDLRFDRDKVTEVPKATTITKRRRNPFAKMFPQFEQIPVSENETGEEYTF